MAQDRVTQPIQGWMGAADPFAMGPSYAGADGIRQFVSGTPPVLAMQPMLDMLDLIEEAGIATIREKSIALTGFAIEVADRSEEHTSALQSLMRISYAVFCLTK